MIFSPDGDGNKDTFKITQNGSTEDKWTAVVTDTAGTVLTIDVKNKKLRDEVAKKAARSRAPARKAVGKAAPARKAK